MATPSTPGLHISASRDQAAHELELVESAVGLVASAGAPRVVLLLSGHARILSRARSIGKRRGVVVRGARQADGGLEIEMELAG